jgi:hypothetical protein
MEARCFQERKILNTRRVDYHERGTDYQDGASRNFGTVHHEIDGWLECIICGRHELTTCYIEPLLSMPRQSAIDHTVKHSHLVI